MMIRPSQPTRPTGRLPALFLAATALATPAGLCAVGALTVAPRDKVVVDAETEKIIDGSLRYLASKQASDGAWYGVTRDEQRYPAAITGYVLMAFQAAGHLPGEGEYGVHVDKGVDYLLESITHEGLYGSGDSGQYMYAHGIATIALGELYGQSRSEKIRPKLERAVKIILSSQNEQGGWRYRPIVRDADISVTVLQVVALRTAKNGGFDVPQSTIDAAVRYVKSCYHDGTGGFAYQPGQGPGFARTAAAIYSLQVCGQYDDPMVAAGSRYLFDNFRDGDRWFSYGHFYAAPAQYMIGGETWKRWYPKIKGVLVKNVRRKDDTFYWESYLDYGKGVGPVYCTAAYSMILSMPYHYIPLYQR